MSRIKNFLLSGLSLSSLLLLNPVHADEHHPKKVICPSTKPAHSVTLGNLKFATDLYNALEPETENLVFSPFSISSSLAMATLGAEGDTFKEMCKVLHLPQAKILIDRSFLQLNESLTTQVAAGVEPIHLKIANSIWAQEGFKIHNAYLNKMMHFWKGGILWTKFRENPDQSRQEINSWVEEETEGLIQDLMPQGSINEMTRMVLVNTIFLRAPWQKGFDPRLTYEASFAGFRENVQTTDYLHQVSDYNLASYEDFAAIELPFMDSKSTSSKLSMVVVLPHVGYSLASIEEKVRPLFFKMLKEDLTSTRVDLHLPKFKVDTQASLKETLKNMGMVLPFEQEGGFPVANSCEKMVITDVIHKATLSIDEGGILAAAATGTSMGTTNYIEPTPFVANRPFLFFVVDKHTKSILFMGRIANLD